MTCPHQPVVVPKIPVLTADATDRIYGELMKVYPMAHSQVVCGCLIGRALAGRPFAGLVSFRCTAKA